MITFLFSCTIFNNIFISALKKANVVVTATADHNIKSGGSDIRIVRSPMERSCRADKRLCCRSQGTQDDIRHRVALHRHAVSRMGVGTDGRSQIETLPDIIILNTQIFISHSVFPVNL